MSTYWLKNFVGVRQSDLELLRVPRPGAEFGIHVTLRTVQTGALLGSVLGPVSTLMFPDKNITLRESFVRGGTNGAMIGMFLGPVITYLSLRNMNSVQLYDKCYRLRFDNDALWQDRATVVSAALGALSNGSMGFVVGIDLALIMSNLMTKSW